jgi:DNA-binding NtrC family response regulator
MFAPTDRVPPVVLIADDEESICFSLSAEVRRLGGRPLVASDGIAALEQARACGGAIDVAFLDVRMPRLDGPTTLQALRQSLPSVRCCLMTAWGAEHLADRCPPSVVILPKPFDLDEFSRVLEMLLEPIGAGTRPE